MISDDNIIIICVWLCVTIQYRITIDGNRRAFSGYGHIAPSTNTGRLITIVYAIFGIPIFLILLADFGKMFTRGIKFLWAFVRRLYYTGSCRKVRRTAPVQVSKRHLVAMTVIVMLSVLMFALAASSPVDHVERHGTNGDCCYRIMPQSATVTRRGFDRSRWFLGHARWTQWVNKTALVSGNTQGEIFTSKRPSFRAGFKKMANRR